MFRTRKVRPQVEVAISAAEAIKSMLREQHPVGDPDAWKIERSIDDLLAQLHELRRQVR